jgi:hypothetical protein
MKGLTNPHLKTRSIGDKTQNDYIPRVKTFSTLLLLPNVTSPLDLLSPFNLTTDT